MFAKRISWEGSLRISLAILFWVSCLSANAAVVRIEFTAVVTSPGSVVGTVAVNDVVSGYITYETGSNPGATGTTIYGGDFAQYFGDTGVLSYHIESSGTVLQSWAVSDPNSMADISDRQVIVYDETSSGFDQIAVYHRDIKTGSHTNTLGFAGSLDTWSSTSLPSTLPAALTFGTLTGWNGAADFAGINYFTADVVSASMSVVPLPAALWLFASAIAWLCLSRRIP